jgi:hypothetical protein
MQAIQGGTRATIDVKASVVHEQPCHAGDDVIGCHCLETLYALLHNFVKVIKHVGLVSEHVATVVFIPVGDIMIIVRRIVITMIVISQSKGQRK